MSLREGAVSRPYKSCYDVIVLKGATSRYFELFLQSLKIVVN